MSHGKHFLSLIDHRSSAFPEITMYLLSHLKQLFRTDQGQFSSSIHREQVRGRRRSAIRSGPGSGVTAVMEYRRSNAPAT